MNDDLQFCSRVAAVLVARQVWIPWLRLSRSKSPLQALLLCEPQQLK